MKKLGFLWLICLGYTLNAQTIFPDNGVWKQKYHSIAWGHGGEILWDYSTYSTYKINGDTLVSNNRFLKLFKNETFSDFIYVDGLKVLCGNQLDSLRVLFDFGLNQGDTFQFNAPSYTQPAYLLKLTVTASDSVQIGNEMRKRISFSEFPGYGGGPLWIQGIGDVNFGGIELDYSYVSWQANTTTLLCFSQDGVNIYGTCMLGLPELEGQSLFYPNPGSGVFTINLKQFSKPARIEIFSSTGSKVFDMTSKENKERVILSGNANGLYFLRISDNEREITSKIVIR